MPGPLKRRSLTRLLASLRPPSRAPVQTGFPTSLADLVVKNHGRLRKPRKPRRPTALDLPPSPAATPVDVEVISPPPSPEPLSPSPVAVRRLDAPKGAPFLRPRPELLALGGAVALALLAVWREGTVAAFTVASLSLLWIESASSRRRRPAELPDSRGRAPASPIGEVEEATRSFSSSDSDKGSEAPSPRSSDSGDDPATPKRKKRRSLRKIISRTLQKKPKAKDASGSSDGEVEQPEDDAEPASTEAFLAPSSTESSPSSEPSTESSPSSVEMKMKMKTEMETQGGRFPLAAFVPVILAGLALGKLPATALAVLCVASFGAVGRPSVRS